MAKRISDEVRVMRCLRALSPEKREAVLNVAVAEFSPGKPKKPKVKMVVSVSGSKEGRTRFALKKPDGVAQFHEEITRQDQSDAKDAVERAAQHKTEMARHPANQNREG